MKENFLGILIIIGVIIYIIYTIVIKIKRGKSINSYCTENGAIQIACSADKKAFTASNNYENRIIVGVVHNGDIDAEIINNFKLSNSIVHSTSGWGFIAFDNDNNNMLFANVNTKNADIQTKLLAYTDIIGVELLQDNIIVSSKSTSRTISGALVGGALAGSTGAVIGGLSGDNVTQNRIQSLALKILVRDLDNPSITISLLNSGGKGVNRTSSHYQELCRIKDTISVIIDKVDTESKTVASTTTSSLSPADEIMKLVKLKELGAITEAEFEQQKRALLN